MNDIKTFFNSETFYNLIKKINVSKTDEWGKMYDYDMFNSDVTEAVQYIVEESIKFYLVFIDDENVLDLLIEYIENIIPIINKEEQFYIHTKCDTLILKYLCNKLNIEYSKDLSVENKEKIFDILYKNIISKDYGFHAFNSSMYDSIKKHGINPNFYLTSQNDLNLVGETYKKNNLYYPFFMQNKNCIGQISYSSAANFSYMYGIDSPEWFSNFCNDKQTYNNPYIKREYDAALDILNKKISNFNNEDKKIVIDFFNKNWNIYASKENIPILAIFELEKENRYITEYGKALEDFKENPDDYIWRECLNRGACDNHINHVDVSNALFIQLPSYNKVVELSKEKYYGEIKNDTSNSLEQLSTFFNSDDFYKIVNEFKPTDSNIKSKLTTLTNYVIKYSLIVGIEDVNLFSNNFVNLCNLGKDEEEVFVTLIKSKISQILIKENKEVNDENIKQYISSKFGNKKLIFHAFNSSKFESIKKYGLTTNISTVNQEKDDIAKIEQIVKKYTSPDTRSLFGFYRDNSKDKIYYSLDPSISYLYANRSPEWFADFVGDSYFYSTEKHGTFFEKNYYLAKDNIIWFANKYNFSDEDKKEVLDFFEKYWNIYGKAKPMLAIIENEYDNSYLEELNLNLYIKTIISGNVNASTEEKISTDNAIFIDLPDYTKTKKYVNKNDKNIIGSLKEYIEMRNSIDNLIEKINFSKDKIKQYSNSNNVSSKIFKEAHEKAIDKYYKELVEFKEKISEYKENNFNIRDINEILSYIIMKIKDSSKNKEDNNFIKIYKEIYNEINNSTFLENKESIKHK